MQSKVNNVIEEAIENTANEKVYFLSLVGTDACDHHEKGIPRSALYFYDIKSEMELERYGIHFLSAQDLKFFYDGQDQQTKIEQLNIYGLVEYFMEHHPYGSYFLDEVPLIQGLKFE